MDRESGVSGCKLFHLEWLSSEVLLYRTGNCIQSPGIDHDGKEHLQKGWVTLLYSRDWHNTVKQLRPLLPTEKKVKAISLGRNTFPFFFRAIAAAYGGSPANGPMRAVAAGLYHSHSKAGSKLRLQPTPELTANPDPRPAEQGWGLNLNLDGY